MPKVTFLPGNLTVDAALGETILEVALNHDIPLQHACGGFCACTTCHLQVESDPSALEPMESEEQDRLETTDGLTAKSRLGCQAKVRADVTVTLVNVD